MSLPLSKRIHLPEHVSKCALDGRLVGVGGCGGRGSAGSYRGNGPAMWGENAVGVALLVVLGTGMAAGLYLQARDAIGYERRLGRSIGRVLLIVAAGVSRVGVPLIVFATDAVSAGPHLARLNLWLTVGCAAGVLVLSFVIASAVRPRANAPYAFHDARFFIKWFGICAAGYLVLRPYGGCGTGPGFAVVYWLVAMFRAAVAPGRD